MAGNQVSGDGVPPSLAGMSKTQLYDIMSQMKVQFLFKRAAVFAYFRNLKLDWKLKLGKWFLVCTDIDSAEQGTSEANSYSESSYD